MKCFFKPLTVSMLILSFLLSGCMVLQSKSQKSEAFTDNIQIELAQYQESDFKQIKVQFFTSKSKELVFRVLSNIEQTPQWLERVNNLEVLDIYNNQQYLLRTIISMPWPFKDRELITCVNTAFEDDFIEIDIYSCTERIAENEQYLRLPQVASNWIIKKVSPSLVEVNYKTWLDPKGNIPAFIFNNELIDSAKVDFKKLQTIIDSTFLDQFTY